MTELKPCPFCGCEAELVGIQDGYAVICSDHNCLGQMRVTYGSCDNREIFKERLIEDWNKRHISAPAVRAAYECLLSYRDDVEKQMQEPYDFHGCCCLEVLDEALNRLDCFKSKAAVEAWNRRANDV